MHNLIVTEKPSAARTISKVLGATARRDGYLEGGGYLISWCVGHLVELAPPGAATAIWKAAATLSVGVWDTWWSWPRPGRMTRAWNAGIAPTCPSCPSDGSTL